MKSMKYMYVNVYFHIKMNLMRKKPKTKTNMGSYVVVSRDGSELNIYKYIYENLFCRTESNKHNFIFNNLIINNLLCFIFAFKNKHFSPFTFLAKSFLKGKTTNRKRAFYSHVFLHFIQRTYAFAKAL